MSTTTASKVFRVKGTTDEVTECELCGRQELKGTIMLAELDADGTEMGLVYYGASCGAKAAGWTTKDVRIKAKAADQAKRDAAQAASDERSRIFCAARDAWISENIGPDAWLNFRRYGYRSTYAMVNEFSEATGIWS